MQTLSRITRSVNDAALRVAVGIQVRAITAGETSAEDNDERRRAVATGWALSTPVALLASAPAALAADKCGDSGSLKTLQQLMNTIANFTIAIGGTLVVVMITFAGILWVTGKHGKAMERFKNALIGLAVMALGAVIKTVVVAILKGGTTGSGGVSDCINKKAGGSFS